jgi:ADP-L-glycero-D-manno-heptose 6-epimerase
MIIVTGGAGFIGSNIVHELNLRGERDILIVDNLASPSGESQRKIRNLQGAHFSDYMDKHEFRLALLRGRLLASRIKAIFHQGACSNTLETDGQYVMDNNFTYSKEVLEFALTHRIPFVYASSAAVYGCSQTFKEDASNERPLNVYGFSKAVFDNYVRRCLSCSTATLVGLRYFNVYGPREEHKRNMASVIHQFAIQLKESGVIKMFEGSGGRAAGEQRRDFVFVADVVKANLFFAFGPPRSGIVNVGTGRSSSFKDVAHALMRAQGEGRIEFIPFPDGLQDHYQSFTEADTSKLREMGYTGEFADIEEGVRSTSAGKTMSH